MKSVIGIFLTVVAISVFAIIVCSNQKHNQKQAAIRAEAEIVVTPVVDVEKVKKFVHIWNMGAYENQSMIRFYANINEDGDYVFTAVNVEVNFDNPDEIAVHKELVEDLAHDWFILTGSKLVRLVNSEGIITFWCDKEGIFHILLPEKMKKEEKKKEGRNV